MKRRKLIRDAFSTRSQTASYLTASTITDITAYAGTLNNVWIYYTNSGTKKLSYTSGPTVV